MNRCRTYSIRIRAMVVASVIAFLPLCKPAALSQGTEVPSGTDTGRNVETLTPVEVEAPQDDARRISARTGQSTGGAGSDQTTPSGMPFSDFPLTPSEVVSPGRRVQNISTVHSAVGVIENRGLTAQGNGGLSDLIQGQPGLWTSGFAGNFFDANIAIRGFSTITPNRVNLLVDGRSLNIPRQELTTSFFFPEMIDRVEVLRGDGTVQFGNKAIGGAVNVILKKPRQFPGTYGGVEGGSWHTDREWASINIVKGPIAAGLFLGRYYQEGWRVFEGNQLDPEVQNRPGPWSLQSIMGSFNWKITPRLTFDIMVSKTDTRAPNPAIDFKIDKLFFERRDTRNFPPADFGIFGQFPFRPQPPEERWDSLGIGRLMYDAGIFGQLDIIGSWRSYDRRTLWDFGNYFRWQDFGLSFQYTRRDERSFVKNDLTAGSDLLDGRMRLEGLQLLPDGFVTSLLHGRTQNGYRESVAYYLLNTITLFERIVIGLGHRTETYDLKNIYSSDVDRTVTVAQQNLTRIKSASLWSLGFIYDTDLGSSVYYKHSRTYRFPNFDDMVNLFISFPPHPDAIWLLDPEEGTLEEFGIRHWFTRNIHASATYYELDMDSEQFFGPDPNAPTMFGLAQRNLNVPLISHWGLELETLIRITPRWTLTGNYARQNVLFNYNWQPGDALQRSTVGKWLSNTPKDMAHVNVAYDNTEWGFSASIAYHYIGTRWLQDDVFNELPEIEPAIWGDIKFSQDFWDGLATLYGGVLNFTDRQYAIEGRAETFSPPTFQKYWPNAGRTMYFGAKSSLDFHRMRLPTVSDLERMNRRLYGVLDQGRSAFTGMGSWMRNLLPYR